MTFILSALASVASTTDMMEEKPTEVMMEDSTDAMKSPNSTATPNEMVSELVEMPAWFDASLINVRTGEDFTINDFKGKEVMVETLAMWCPNCKKQQSHVKALHGILGMNKDLISIGLDIDPNENADLKNYTDSNGFVGLRHRIL
jgi:thiol-disulfide isomerase/thioredoxin